MEVYKMKRMNKINVLLIAAAVLVMGGLFGACEQPATVKKVTVTFFDPLGEVECAPVTVEQGQTLGDTFPANPDDALVEGVTYYFYGWFDGETEYDDETPIGASITLFARWRQTPPEYITVNFEFTQTDEDGDVLAPGTLISPTAPVNSIKVIKGKKLGISQLPVVPRSKGFKFNAWYDGAAVFNLNTVLNANKTLTAKWDLAETWTVTFDSGTGAPVVNPITVYKGECIDEWEVNFPEPFGKGSNSVNPTAFFVAWLDEENREYDGRVVINRNLALKARWGLPPYIVNFATDIAEVQNHDGTSEGTTSYNAVVRDAWDSTVANPKKVIVNEITYDVPDNTNRWKILYRVKMQLGSFNVNFYTRYTIRARFYANKQGAKSWTDMTQFTPNKPANGSGYNANGLLRGVSSPSDDGWGQISFTLVENWDGQGASADTMIQRYNLDRKGGTIDDSWTPLRGTTLPWPPYLLIQTSDNYIGHIEITQIVFHNGEKKYTMYEDEEGYDKADDGYGD
jgi:hypothetical protein